MELNALLHKKTFTKDEIIHLLNLSEENERNLLYKAADELRRELFGQEVHFRGVIEFSNYCERNCVYCGLREENFTVERYRMSADEIIETAKRVSNLGIHTIVLQSGEDTYYDTDILAYIIYSIKQNADVAVTLSIGERGFDEYRAWKFAGADRYLLKHETANPRLYAGYHNREQLTNKIQHLKYLKRLGYQIGSGNMIGLPNQKIEDIAEDILLCKELDADMFAVGPFIPAPFTPYQKRKSGSVELTLNTMAVARLVLRDVHIPSTTALDTIDMKGREKGLCAGANVVMPNFTPAPYREKYRVYANKRGSDENPVTASKKLQSRVEAIGMRLSDTRGDSLKMKKDSKVSAI